MKNKKRILVDRVIRELQVIRDLNAEIARKEVVIANHAIRLEEQNRLIAVLEEGLAQITELNERLNRVQRIE